MISPPQLGHGILFIEFIIESLKMELGNNAQFRKKIIILIYYFFGSGSGFIFGAIVGFSCKEIADA